MTGCHLTELQGWWGRIFMMNIPNISSNSWAQSKERGRKENDHVFMARCGPETRQQCCSRVVWEQRGGSSLLGKYHPMCHHMMFKEGTGWYYNQRRHKTVILSYRLRCSHFQFSNFITFPSIEKFLSHLRFSPLKFHVMTLTLITSLIQRDGLKIMILSVRLSRERCHLHIVREVTGNKIVAKLS